MSNLKCPSYKDGNHNFVPNCIPVCELSPCQHLKCICGEEPIEEKKEWPKLKRDYKGLRVRLVRPVGNNGGERAEAGRTATIDGWHQGLKLWIDVCDKCGTKMYITHVAPESVELI